MQDTKDISAYEVPTVHQAVANVMREITHLHKDGKNEHFGFRFRGIDALLGAIAQPLRNHGVIIAPRLKSVDSEVIGKSVRTVVQMEYDIYGPRGDHFTVCYPGEAADQGDKSVGKACSYAFKMLCFALFAIPVDADSVDDPDRVSPQLDYSQRRDNRFYREAPRMTAQDIYEAARTMDSTHGLRGKWQEANASGVLDDEVKPRGGDPAPLRDVLMHLKASLEEVA